MNSASMACEISQTFFFDAAHTLERAIETESSKRIHGHTYNAEVFLTGQPDPATGMVIDLGLVQREVAVLREQLDRLGRSDIGIVLKIETLRGFENLPERRP